MHSPPAHLALAALAVAGCGFSAGLDGNGRFRCSDDQGCPAGLQCSIAGYCETAGDGGPPAPDAGATAACGTTDALRDSFEDPQRFDWYWIESSSEGGTAMAIDDGLVLELPIGPAGFAGRIADRWYRFRDSSSLTVRVAERPSGAGRLSLRLEFPGGADARITLTGDSITVDRDDGSGRATIGSAVYDPAQPLWRVRDDGGSLVFETGDDSDDWREIAALPDAPATPVQISFYLHDEERKAPIRAVLDDLNQRAEGSLCPASSLVDDFDDGEIGVDWATWTFGTCEFFEEGGQLRFRNMGEVYNDCGYRSRAGYDMTDQAIDVEVVPPEPDSGGLNFTLRIADGVSYAIRLRAQTLAMEAWAVTEEASTRLGSAEYSSDVRFWRLEHQSDTGELRFLYSGDGAAWTILAATQGTDLDNVRIALFASEFATGDGAVAFDRLNQ